MCPQQVPQQLCVQVQMRILHELVGEIFNAAIAVASEKDADLRYNEVRGAFVPIKEDTWQEVCRMRLAVCCIDELQTLLHSHSKMERYMSTQGLGGLGNATW